MRYERLNLLLCWLGHVMSSGCEYPICVLSNVVAFTHNELHLKYYTIAEPYMIWQL